MELPAYWLRRPPMALDDNTRAACDALLAHARTVGPADPLTYPLDIPVWQFLCYLAEAHGVALHGSQNPTIAQFVPQQPQDLNTFGAQRAVYAAADGIWPLYFALLDRTTFPTTLMNGCIRVRTADGALSEPHYLFSVNRNVLPRYPWRAGTIYLLPRETFVAEPAFAVGPMTIETPQLASLVSVTPFAKLTVRPADFPFLAHVETHDDAHLAQYAAAVQTGAPWPVLGSDLNEPRR